MKVVKVFMMVFVLMFVASTCIAEPWPPTTRLMKALSCNDPIDLCAIQLQTGGAIDVTCATRTPDGAKNLYKVRCTLNGSIQTCIPSGITVNMSDIPAVKCAKICKPATSACWK